MQDYPHHYVASAHGRSQGNVSVTGSELADLETNSPPEFGGPSGYWSPETLLLASVADCFILSFRAVARASGLEWSSLNCEVEGVLDKEDKTTRFTRFAIKPTLTLQNAGDRKKAEHCLEKAEHICLITNSLNAEKVLTANIEIEGR